MLRYNNGNKKKFDSIDRKIINKTSDVLYIEDFNPVGDGVTDDQTAIVNAVTEAYSRDMALMWADKTYLTSGNIPDFHKVKHLGEGIIKRGTDLFYISPRGSQRNKIYVKPTTSSNTFDGLSLGQPVRSLQVAFNFLTNYTLSGFWEIVLAEGTHATHGYIKEGLLSENPIAISGVDVGGHPNVPTTILSEGVGVSASGIYASYGTSIEVKNIKIIGYNGSVYSAGLKAAYGAYLTTSNVHTDQCYWGVSGSQQAYITVPDGIHSNNGFLNTETKETGSGACIRSLQQTNHYIGSQSATDVSKGAIFRNSSYGIFVQEFSTGHVNWVTVEDCVTGMRTQVNSRINADGMLFKRNIRDIRNDSSSHVGVTSTMVFSTGADASGMSLVRSSGAQILGSQTLDYEMTYSLTENIYSIKDVNTTYNTGGADTTFHSTLLKTPHWKVTLSDMVLGKKIKFKVFGKLNGTANNKRIIVRLDDGTVYQTAALIFTSSETGDFTAEGHVYFLGNTSQFLSIEGSRHLGTGKRHGTSRASCDASKNITLSLQCRLDDTTATDSVKIDMVEVKTAG